ncbi:MAG: hypothetical protein AB7U38_07355 [Hyphomicrobiales bacterium]
MDARTQPQEQAPDKPVPGTVFTPRQVRVLKVAVIFMGILLVGGFALVMGAIVYQASNLGKSAVPAAIPAGEPARAELALPEGARILNMATGEGKLVLHVEAGGAGELVILDMATAKVLSRVRLRTQ